MKKIITLAIVGCIFWLSLVGCIPQKALYLSYQGWKDENTYVYNWSELTETGKVDGKRLKEIAHFLEKEHGFYRVVILNWQRFER